MMIRLNKYLSAIVIAILFPAFAQANDQCEYNNSVISGDDGEIVIIPETLAQYCCLDAEKLTDMQIIKDCTNKLLTKMHDKDNSVNEVAQETYGKIMSEQSKYGLAEALDETNIATSYLADVLKKYKEDMTNSSTTGDDISTISITNTQLLYLLNRIRRIYTTSLTSVGYEGIGSVQAKDLKVELDDKAKAEGEEETDIGLGNSEEEYEFSVIRNEITYPLIPENMARKCAIQINEGIDKLRDCYIQSVKDMHAPNVDDAKIAKNYASHIKYQNVLDVLAKSLYQKVKSAKYDEELQEAKDKNADATTVRTKSDGLFNTDKKIQEALDDIVNLLASRIAHSSIEFMSKLTVPEEPTKTEG